MQNSILAQECRKEKHHVDAHIYYWTDQHRTRRLNLNRSITRRSFHAGTAAAERECRLSQLTLNCETGDCGEQITFPRCRHVLDSS